MFQQNTSSTKENNFVRVQNAKKTIKLKNNTILSKTWQEISFGFGLLEFNVLTVTDISRQCQPEKLIPLLPWPGFDPSFSGHNDEQSSATTPQTAQPSGLSHRAGWQEISDKTTRQTAEPSGLADRRSVTRLRVRPLSHRGSAIGLADRRSVTRLHIRPLSHRGWLTGDQWQDYTSDRSAIGAGWQEISDKTTRQTAQPSGLADRRSVIDWGIPSLSSRNIEVRIFFTFVNEKICCKMYLGFWNAKIT